MNVLFKSVETVKKMIWLLYNTFSKKVHQKMNAHLISQNEDLKEQLDWFKKHAEITSLKPATGFIRNKQLRQLAFVESFMRDFNNLELHPFVIAGSLIGSVRHKGFIPWDDDLDFGLIREEYNKLIEYFKENYHVELYSGKWSEYSNDKHLQRMDELVRKYPNQYVLDIWVDQIQVMKGTSCLDRLALDFFSFDYYDDNYCIEDHLTYLQEIDKKRKEIDIVSNIVSFLNTEINQNPNISTEKTSHVFPGIDSIQGYYRIKQTFKWIDSNSIFPLKKCEFENTQLWTAKDEFEFLEYQCPDYMEYPDDVGLAPHEWYVDEYLVRHYPSIEFYLIDAFEIFHFLPLYYLFYQNGIYVKFVAEPQNYNVSGSWFDYEQAVEILETNRVRYSKKCNPNCDYAFTTQDAPLLRKYKNKKIHITYGYGFANYSFCESEKTLKGFDYKFVHGSYTYNKISGINNLPQIYIMGYPKYMWDYPAVYKEPFNLEDEIRRKNTHNKPILVYFPTWDLGSSISWYWEEIIKLKDRFFIITKAHHCTSRLESEHEHRNILYRISDIVCEGNFDFGKIASTGNIAICDAMTGAATEVALINKDIDMLLLYSPLPEKNDFKKEIFEFAYCVKTSEEFMKGFNMIYGHDSYKERRNELLKEIYEFTDESCLDDFLKEVKAKKENK